MSLIALIALAGSSIASTLYGLIFSWIKRRRRPTGDANKRQYYITVEEGGNEVEYRIESDNPQQAEDAIRQIIERNAYPRSTNLSMKPVFC
jgi:hypothetical protein